MLFPLPLTAFENYMLADDLPGQPMCFYLRLNFFGRLDQRALQAALRLAVARQPLFRARVVTLDGTRHWVREHNLQPRLFWNDEAPCVPEGDCFLDLSREVGLRVYVGHEEGQARLTFQFHHVCVDGMGAVQFMEDVLTLYTAEQSGAPSLPTLRPLCPAALRDRGRHGLSFVGRLMRLPVDALASLGILQFFCNRPLPLRMATRVPQTPVNRGGPASVMQRLGDATLKALRAEGRRRGVTLNDLLVRDLMLAIDRWNQNYQPTARGGCQRVSVPVNLRRAADAKLPATNVVSMVFMDRRVGEKTSPERLLKSIRRDTFFIKMFRLALVFTWVVEMLHAVRGGFRWLLRGPQCLATAVLSNLGVQFDDLPLAYLADRVIVGDALLDSIEFLPPIRSETNAALGVVTYAGELMVSLQYDQTALDAEAARGLLAQFTRQLAMTAGLVHEFDVEQTMEAAATVALAVAQQRPIAGTLLAR